MLPHQPEQLALQRQSQMQQDASSISIGHHFPWNLFGCFVAPNFRIMDAPFHQIKSASYGIKRKLLGSYL